MLHFEVQIKKGLRSDNVGTVLKPSKYPAFILVHNDDWNDYGYYTWFSLFYFAEKEERPRFIGELKLLCRNNGDTYSAIKEGFDGRLSDDFCSLGIDSSYYRRMREVLKDTSLIAELLRCMRDCATDAFIYEQFCDDDGFKDSLMRDLSAERAFREAKLLISNEDETTAYSFEYTYSPIYNKELSTKWNVRFEYDSPPFLRSAAIIGVNGAGKTQMLLSTIKDLLKQDTPNFNHTPLFSCCIAISSTPLDGYNNLGGESPRIEYYPCSLEQKDAKTEEELAEAISIIEKRATVHGKSMLEVYVSLLEEHLGEIVEDLFTINENTESYLLNREYLTKIVRILSSGQIHTLLLITHICSKIHFSSLLIIDEPEVHLHPKTIMDFMTTLNELLRKFESFAIISTHSPLIVREIVSSNVYLMQQMEGGIPCVSTVQFDTFGEDVTTLYRKIFGYDESNSYFRNLIKKGIKKEKSFDKVVSKLEKHMKLSLNARLTIRDIFNEQQHEEH